jgi:hypothetical protein
MAALQYCKPGLQYDMRALQCDKPALSYCMPRLRYDNAGMQYNRGVLQYDKRADVHTNECGSSRLLKYPGISRRIPQTKAAIGFVRCLIAK